MSGVMKMTNEEVVTMTSLEVVELINNFRKEEGNQVELLHKSFLASIDTELESLKKCKISQQNILPSTYINSRGKEYRCYKMNKAGIMQMLNKESALVRYKTQQYIEALENKLKNNLPTTYKEALLQLVEQVEANEKLQLENQELKPKALFADAVSASNTSILVGELAKILKQNGINTGQKRFFEWLRNNGYLIKRKGVDYNMPTQKSMEQGLFEIKETTINHSDGHISISKTPKVTGKGQIYFINKLKPVTQLALAEA